MTRKKQPPAVSHCEGQGKIGQGRAVFFAEGEQAKQWVCEEEVEVLIVEPPRGAEILGPVVGTTTKPLDEKPKVNKRCSNCNNTQPGLKNEDYAKTMLFDQLEPGEEGPGGRLHVVCCLCSLDDDDDNFLPRAN